MKSKQLLKLGIMKNLKFAEALNSEVENIVENTKVSAAFVQELKEAFLMFPVRTDMRFKQSSKGELIISVTVVYATGMTQHFEGAGDADLISAIHFGMAKMINGLHDYKAEEHEVEIAQEGENLVIKFCMKATDEVNSLICEACKPEWMKKSEAEAKQQVPEQNEVA